MFAVIDESTIDNDILTANEECIVITVNLEGVAGRGLALSWKNIYNKEYLIYRKHCKDGNFKPHKLLILKAKAKNFICFPTKRSWRMKSNLSDILDLCSKLNTACQVWKIKSIAIPPLGQVNGWLSEDAIFDIHDTLKNAFDSSDVSATYYIPKYLIDKLNSRNKE